MVDLSIFDPNAAGNPQYNIFGLPFSEDDARLVIQPVPWEATVNIYPGTARCITSIMRHSIHLDLWWKDHPNLWKQGIHIRESNQKILLKSDYLRKEAELLVGYTCCGKAVCDNDFMQRNLKEINAGSAYLNTWVYDHTKTILDKGKLAALLGGDHSICFGFVQALSEIHADFGILQIDAHCDLRKNFEGFTYSHASIMRNILDSFPQVSKLVQVGIRDFCEEECSYLHANTDRVKTFFDEDLNDRLDLGESWSAIARSIVDELPQQVYISFDIDGLKPYYCPSTNMPIVGGLEYNQLKTIFKLMKKAGKTIIGFDLCEIGNGRIGTDAQVGAYILWDLCNQILHSNS
ncbi:MAG: arginase family protein [Chitinophagaceae bacterium]